MIPPMTHPKLAIAALLLAPLLPSKTPAQAPATAATALSKARALYYTPVDAGLQGFTCEVNFNWREFMQKAANAPIPDGDPRLAYLQSIKLSIEDDLHTGGRLNWTAPGPEPDGTEDSVDKVRGGLQQLWSGFFQTWNGFVTGDIVTLDTKSTVEQTAAGFHVRTGTSANFAEEQFDPKLLLQSVHVTTPDYDSTIAPTFLPGTRGLLVTSMRSQYRKPPASDPTEVVMQVTYAPVNSFELPAEVKVAVGPAAFDFHLINCTVRTQLSQK